MKKLLQLFTAFLIVTLVFFANNLKAQSANTVSPWRLGLGLEAGAPTGNEHDNSNFDLGATARLQYDVSKSFALTLTSGLYNFFGKDYTNTIVTSTYSTTFSGKSADLHIIPLKAGAKFFVGSNIYLDGEVGAGFEIGPYSSTKLILSPGLGYASKSWDFGLRYESFSGVTNDSFGLVALRVAYGFGL